MKTPTNIKHLALVFSRSAFKTSRHEINIIFDFYPTAFAFYREYFFHMPTYAASSFLVQVFACITTHRRTLTHIICIL